MSLDEPLLVVGIGRLDAGDDAAGRLAARLFRERAGAGIRVVECEGDALSLLDAWAGAGRVVLLDAAVSGATPGTLHRFEVGRAPLPAVFERRSTHGFGVGEAVALARALGRLPPTLVVLGIEGKRFEPGTHPCSEVLHALPRFVERVVEETQALVSGASVVD